MPLFCRVGGHWNGFLWMIYRIQRIFRCQQDSEQGPVKVLYRENSRQSAVGSRQWAVFSGRFSFPGVTRYAMVIYHENA